MSQIKSLNLIKDGSVRTNSLASLKRVYKPLKTRKARNSGGAGTSSIGKIHTLV